MNMCRNSGCYCKEERKNSSRRGKEMLKARRKKHTLPPNKRRERVSRSTRCGGLGCLVKWSSKLFVRNYLRPKNPTRSSVFRVLILTKSWRTFTQMGNNLWLPIFNKYIFAFPGTSSQAKTDPSFTFHKAGKALALFLLPDRGSAS